MSLNMVFHNPTLQRSIFSGWKLSGVATLFRQITLLIIAQLPHSLAYPLARGLARMSSRRLPNQYRSQTNHLSAKLGVTETQAEKLLLRSLELGMLETLDIFLVRGMKKETQEQVIEITGLDRLAQALQPGRGALLYSTHHWGKFAFFAGVGVNGFRPNILRREMKSSPFPFARWFYNYSNSIIEKLGCRYFWLGHGKTGAVEFQIDALQQNQTVVLLLDGSQWKQSVEVDFFGARAIFPRGPATLARQTGAPLIPFFVHREDDGRQTAEIGEPLYATDDVESTMQQCACRLEAYIRQYPAQWERWYLFDLWKQNTRPANAE